MSKLKKLLSIRKKNPPLGSSSKDGAISASSSSLARRGSSLSLHRLSGSVENLGAYTLKDKDVGKLSKFLKAAYNGDLQKLKQIATKKVNWNEIDKHKRTALHFSCSRGHVDVVEFLVTNSANVNLTDIEGKTPLIKACENNNTDIVKILLQNSCETNNYDSGQMTAFHYAAAHGNIDIGYLLADRGAKLDPKDADQATPLHICSEMGHTEFVEFFLSEYVAVDSVDNLKKTPLMLAATEGHDDIVQLLIDNNADLTLQDQDGMTAQELASKNDQTSTAALLESAIVKKNKVISPSASNRSKESVKELFSPTAKSLNEMFSSKTSTPSHVSGGIFGGPAVNVIDDDPNLKSEMSQSEDNLDEQSWADSEDLASSMDAKKKNNLADMMKKESKSKPLSPIKSPSHDNIDDEKSWGDSSIDLASSMDGKSKTNLAEMFKKKTEGTKKPLSPIKDPIHDENLSWADSDDLASSMDAKKKMNLTEMLKKNEVDGDKAALSPIEDSVEVDVSSSKRPIIMNPDSRPNTAISGEEFDSTRPKSAKDLFSPTAKSLNEMFGAKKASATSDGDDFDKSEPGKDDEENPGANLAKILKNQEKEKETESESNWDDDDDDDIEDEFAAGILTSPKKVEDLPKDASDGGSSIPPPVFTAPPPPQGDLPPSSELESSRPEDSFSDFPLSDMDGGTSQVDVPNVFGVDIGSPAQFGVGDDPVEEESKEHIGVEEDQEGRDSEGEGGGKLEEEGEEESDWDSNMSEALGVGIPPPVFAENIGFDIPPPPINPPPENEDDDDDFDFSLSQDQDESISHKESPGGGEVGIDDFIPPPASPAPPPPADSEFDFSLSEEGNVSEAVDEESVIDNDKEDVMEETNIVQPPPPAPPDSEFDFSLSEQDNDEDQGENFQLDHEENRLDAYANSIFQTEVVTPSADSGPNGVKLDGEIEVDGENITKDELAVDNVIDGRGSGSGVGSSFLDFEVSEVSDPDGFSEYQDDPPKAEVLAPPNIAPPNLPPSPINDVLDLAGVDASETSEMESESEWEKDLLQKRLSAATTPVKSQPDIVDVIFSDNDEDGSENSDDSGKESVKEMALLQKRLSAAISPRTDANDVSSETSFENDDEKEKELLEKQLSRSSTPTPLAPNFNNTSEDPKIDNKYTDARLSHVLSPIGGKTRKLPSLENLKRDSVVPKIEKIHQEFDSFNKALKEKDNSRVAAYEASKRAHEELMAAEIADELKKEMLDDADDMVDSASDFSFTPELEPSPDRVESDSDPPSLNHDKAKPDFGISARPDFGISAKPDFGISAKPDFGISAKPDFELPHEINYESSEAEHDDHHPARRNKKFENEINEKFDEIVRRCCSRSPAKLDQLIDKQIQVNEELRLRFSLNADKERERILSEALQKKAQIEKEIEYQREALKLEEERLQKEASRLKKEEIRLKKMEEEERLRRTKMAADERQLLLLKEEQMLRMEELSHMENEWRKRSEADTSSAEENVSKCLELERQYEEEKSSMRKEFEKEMKTRQELWEKQTVEREMEMQKKLAAIEETQNAELETHTQQKNAWLNRITELEERLVKEEEKFKMSKDEQQRKLKKEVLALKEVQKKLEEEKDVSKCEYELKEELLLKENEIMRHKLKDLETQVHAMPSLVEIQKNEENREKYKELAEEERRILRLKQDQMLEMNEILEKREELEQLEKELRYAQHDLEEERSRVQEAKVDNLVQGREKELKDRFEELERQAKLNEEKFLKKMREMEIDREREIKEKEFLTEKIEAMARDGSKYTERFDELESSYRQREEQLERKLSGLHQHQMQIVEEEITAVNQGVVEGGAPFDFNLDALDSDSPYKTGIKTTMANEKITELQKDLINAKRHLNVYKEKAGALEHIGREMQYDMEEMHKMMEILNAKHKEKDKKAAEMELELEEMKYKLNKETEEKNLLQKLHDQLRDQLAVIEGKLTSESDLRRILDIGNQKLQNEIQSKDQLILKLENEVEDAKSKLHLEQEKRMLQDQKYRDQIKQHESALKEMEKASSERVDAVNKLEVLDETRRQAEGTVNSLNMELAQAKNELARAQSSLEETQWNMSEQADKLRGKLDEKNEKLLAVEKELFQLQLQHENEKLSKKTVEERLARKMNEESVVHERFEEEVLSLKQQLKNCHGELQEMNTKLVAADGEGVALKTSKMKNFMERDLEVTMEKLTIVEGKLSASEKQIQMLREEVKKKSNAGIVDENNNINAGASNLKVLGEAQKTNRNLEEKLQDEKMTSLKLETKLEAAQERIRLIQQDKEKLSLELAAVKEERLIQARALYDERQNSGGKGALKEAFNEEKMELMGRLKQNNIQLDDLREQLSNKERELMEKTRKLSLAMQDLEYANQRMQNGQGSMDGQRDKLLRDNSELKQSLNDTESRVGKLTNEKKELEIRVNDLKLELEKAKANSSDFSTRYQKKSKEVEKMRLENHEIQSDLQEMKKKKSVLESNLREEQSRADALERDLLESKRARDSIEQQLNSATANYVADKSHLNGPKMLELQQENVELKALVDQEKRKLKKALESKKSSENKIEIYQKRSLQHQEEVSSLKNKLKQLQRRSAKDGEANDARLPALRAEFEMERQSTTANLSKLRMQLDQLSDQLTREQEMRSSEEKKNRDQLKELTSLKTQEKVHTYEQDKLHRQIRDLQLENQKQREYYELNFLPVKEIEDFKKAIETKARVDLNKKLEEVNIHLEEQSNLREAYDKLRSGIERKTKYGFEETVKELKNDLTEVKASLHEGLTKRDTSMMEAQRFKDLFQSERSNSERLAEELAKSTERLSFERSRANYLFEETMNKSKVTKQMFEESLEKDKRTMLSTPLRDDSALSSSYYRSKLLGTSPLTGVGTSPVKRYNNYLT